MDLKKFFEKNKKAALAFSGGVDSVFLMFMAKRYGADIKAYFIDSAFQTEEDRKDAQRAAEQCGFELEFIYSDVLSDKRISLNSPERCYYCKHKLLSSVIEKAHKDGYNTVIDGNNASDSFEDRPGMRAVAELGVISPLRDCGLTKDDIRWLSEEEGIFTWDKPSNSCLATRIAGGLHITEENLKIVESAEDSLKAIGFSDFRVRYNSDFFLLQFKPKQLAEALTHRDEILNVMKKFGKAAVYIDLKGEIDSMEQKEIRQLLELVACGSMSVDDAVSELKLKPFVEIENMASLDLHRGLRQGSSEVVYGRSKTKEQIDIIVHKLYESGQSNVMITGMSKEAAEYFTKDIPFTYYETAKIGLAGVKKEPETEGKIIVATGGTSDIPVAEEAALTAEIMGSKVTRIYDVGVAGIHRLLAHAHELMSARVIVAIAGMEGALPSVIGGLVDCPVIAVPTSVGYGASFGGVSALLGMLNSCASGVSVVNIDNGFGAGYLADKINRIGEK